MWKKVCDRFLPKNMNPDMESFIISTLAMSYLNYLQESPNFIPVYEYMKVLHNLTGQYLTQLNIMEKQHK